MYIFNSDAAPEVKVSTETAQIKQENLHVKLKPRPIPNWVEVKSYLNSLAEAQAENLNAFKICVRDKLTKNIKMKDNTPLFSLTISKDDIKIHAYLNIEWNGYPFYKDKGWNDHFANSMNGKITQFYQRDISEEVWKNNFKNILSKSRSISLEQFFTTYTNASEIMKDHEVRIMAETIRKSLVEYELVICERPEDYAEMFSVMTGSCMYRPRKGTDDSPGGMSNYQSPKWDSAYQEYKIHPASWYHYTLTSKGCFLRNKETKVAVARCMLYQDEKGEWNTYGDMKYEMNSSPQARFLQLLKEFGFTKALPGNWKCTKEFRIPAIKIGGKDHCPLPFGDRVSPRMSISYDAAAHEFLFSPSEKSYGSHYSFSGFIPSDTVAKYKIPEVKAA